jgi:hypothetical protein
LTQFCRRARYGCPVAWASWLANCAVNWLSPLYLAHRLRQVDI